MTSGNIMRRGSMVGTAAVGLMTAAWLSVAHTKSDEHLASDGALLAAAESHGRGLNGSDGQAMRSLDDAIEFVRARRETLRQVADFTAVFSKTELLNERLVSQTMDMKFRERPFSVYLRSHSKRKPAREVIFVEGKNDDKLMLHESGFKALITLSLKPDDPRVMAENRYPITDIGLAKMLDIVLAIWENDKQVNPTDVEVLYSAATTFGSSECEEIRVTHPQRVAGLKFHISRISFDVKTRFPVLLEQYDWPSQPGEPPPLVEQYLYSDIKPNSGLADADFDPENSEYNF